MSPAAVIRPMLLVALVGGAFAPTAARAQAKPGPWTVIADSLGSYAFLTIDPVARRLLASHEGDATADFFDLDTARLLARVKVGAVVSVVVDPQTGRYYASVADGRRLAVVDGTTLRETGSIAVPGEPDLVLLDAPGRRLFVTTDRGSQLWVMNVDTRTLVATIPVPAGPEGMAHDGAAHRLYLNSSETNQVSVIDTEVYAVVATWPTGPALAPHGLACDAARARVYVAGDNGRLVALDTGTGRVVAVAAIGEHTEQIAFDAALGRLYCAAPDWLTVVQVTDTGLSPVERIPTAPGAKNVAVDPKTHAVWTTFTDGEDAFARSWTVR